MCHKYLTLITQSPLFASSQSTSISNFAKIGLKPCDHSFIPKQAFYPTETFIFELKIGVFEVAHKLVQLTLR